MTSTQTAQQQDSRAAAAQLPLVIDWIEASIARWRSLGMLGLSEARLAAMGVAAMVFFAALAAMLAFTAWLAANGLLVALLLESGTRLELAVIPVALVNAVAAGICWSRALSLTRHLEFAHTRRVLGAVGASRVPQ